MLLSISNIAWEKRDDPFVLNQLASLGIKGIEIAPTKIWQNWQGINKTSIIEYRKYLEDFGLSVPAMQAILFGKSHLQLFNKNCHKEFLEHIKLVATIAIELGAKVLVFGAPQNRRRGQISIQQANDIAIEFFQKAAEICINMECCIALEPNPVEYNCDYITNVQDARLLVDSVDHSGFQLHLDISGIYMCGGDMCQVIQNAGDFVHYHISEPMLNPLVEGVIDHEKAISMLKKIKYNNWISIEMKKPDNFQLVLDSVTIIKNIIR